MGSIWMVEEVEGVPGVGPVQLVGVPTVGGVVASADRDS